MGESEPKFDNCTNVINVNTGLNTALEFNVIFKHVPGATGLIAIAHFLSVCWQAEQAAGVDSGCSGHHHSKIHGINPVHMFFCAHLFVTSS